MSHHLTIPATISRYFASVGADGPVHIEQEYTPGSGWGPTNFRKRPSATWAHKLQREGITHIAVRCGVHLADFRIEELWGKTGLRG